MSLVNDCVRTAEFQGRQAVKKQKIAILCFFVVLLSGCRMRPTANPDAPEKPCPKELRHICPF